MRVLIIFLLFPFITQAQIISTVAGDGILGYSGDSCAATLAKLHFPGKVLVDGVGNFYIADSWNHVIRKVAAASGIITTIAGTGTYGYNGDGIPATSAQLNDPLGLAMDTSGNLYIGDNRNNRVRKIDHSTGIITTVAGNGISAGTGIGATIGDGGLAIDAELGASLYIALDRFGNLFISDEQSMVIRKVDGVTGIITNYAGNGFGSGTTMGGFSGDSGLAVNAELNNPCGIAFDSSGNLFIADYVNQRIRKINTSTGIITNVAGNGIPADSGDGTPAIVAELQYPYDIVFNAVGNYYVAEFKGKIREVDISGIINTVVGTSVYGYNGDGILADTAELNETTGISIDVCGNLYIADADNERIRKVTYTPIPITLTNTLTASPTDTVCAGISVTFNSTTVTSSSGSITYQWYVNGSPIAATSSTYTYTPANGDSIRCVATATNPCTSAITSSNSIYMVVNPYSVPTITVTAPMSAPVGATVTVTATVAGTGSSYNINWYDNAVLFNTTSVPVVTYTKGAGTDVIMATVIPSSGEGGCYDSISSGADTVTVNNLRTPSISPQGGVTVFPNPVKGDLSLTLSTSASLSTGSGGGTYRLFSVVGAVLLQGNLIAGSNNIDVSSLASGVYILEVTDNAGEKTTTKIVKE